MLAILINKTKYDSIIVGSCVVQIIKKIGKIYIAMSEVIRQFNTDEKPIKHQFTPYKGTEEIMYIIYYPHSTI